MPNNKGSRLGLFGLYLLLGILLFGGVGVGLLTAKLLAPGSAFAQLVGLLMLPLCLAVGAETAGCAVAPTGCAGLATAGVRGPEPPCPKRDRRPSSSRGSCSAWVIAWPRPSGVSEMTSPRVIKAASTGRS